MWVCTTEVPANPGPYMNVSENLDTRRMNPLILPVLAEHASRVSLKPSYGSLVRARVLKQGDSSLSFYSPVSVRETK